MRIAQDLSISQVRKAGKSLTVLTAATFTRGRSGRARLKPERPPPNERGLAFLGCRIVAGPCYYQSRLEGKTGVKCDKRGEKSSNMLHTPRTAQLSIL